MSDSDSTEKSARVFGSCHFGRVKLCSSSSVYLMSIAWRLIASFVNNQKRHLNSQLGKGLSNKELKCRQKWQSCNATSEQTECYII